MQPVHSRGSPNKGTKSEVAASSLPSWGPTRGPKCYATCAFSGVPKQGDKIRSGCLILAFWGAHKWAKVLCNLCILGGPQTRGQNQKWLPHPCLLGGPKEGQSAMQPVHSRGSPNMGTKSEVAASALPSWGPTSGPKCYVTYAFSGVLKQGDKIRSGCLNPAFLGAHKWAEVLCNRCILGGRQTRGQNQKWLPHPCLLGGPKEGQSAMQPVHSRGSPNMGTKSEVAASALPSWGPTSGPKCYVTYAFSGVLKQGDKIRSGCLTFAFSGAEVLNNPCSLGAPKQGDKIRNGRLTPLPSRGAARGRNCYVTYAFSGVPKQGDKIRSGCLTPLPSWGPTSGPKCYVTYAFSGVLKQGDKIRSGCLNPAFLGAHKWAEVLCNRCILGGRQTRGQNQKWLPQPCLLGGPQVGQSAM